MFFLICGAVLGKKKAKRDKKTFSQCLPSSVKIFPLEVSVQFDEFPLQQNPPQAPLVSPLLTRLTTSIYSERANSNGFDSKLGVGWLQFASMPTLRKNRHSHKKSLSCSLSRSIRVSTVSGDIHTK